MGNTGTSLALGYRAPSSSKLTYSARQRAAVVLWAMCTGSNRLFHRYNFFRDVGASPVSAHPVVPAAGAMAVDEWKAAVPGGFRYAAASLPAMAPFPGVTVRTEPANFVYPALRGENASRTRNPDSCDLQWRNFGQWHDLRPVKRGVFGEVKVGERSLHSP